MASVSPEEPIPAGPPVADALAVDPVCGMPVARERAIALEHEGRLAYFCSRGCRDEFLGLGPARDEARAEELVRRVLAEPGLLRAVFQPIVSIETGAVVGYEALARFAAVPAQPPEAWFELAARAGLTADLEARALERALDVVVRRPPPDGAFVSLNVSPLLLDDERIGAALAAAPVPAAASVAAPGRAAALAAASVPAAALGAGPTAAPAGPSRIVLELTERDQVAGYDRLRAVLAPYRARGIAIAVDDTGAGYASLRHLTELGPEFVKLDARLVTGLTGDRARQALVRAMTTFAAEIGSILVAEGVERLADLDLLLRAGGPVLVQGRAVAEAGEPWPVFGAEARERLRLGVASRHGRPVRSAESS